MHSAQTKSANAYSSTQSLRFIVLLVRPGCTPLRLQRMRLLIHIPLMTSLPPPPPSSPCARPASFSSFSPFSPFSQAKHAAGIVVLAVTNIAGCRWIIVTGRSSAWSVRPCTEGVVRAKDQATQPVEHVHEGFESWGCNRYFRGWRKLSGNRSDEG